MFYEEMQSHLPFEVHTHSTVKILNTLGKYLDVNIHLGHMHILNAK